MGVKFHKKRVDLSHHEANLPYLRPCILATVPAVVFLCRLQFEKKNYLLKALSISSPAFERFEAPEINNPILIAPPAAYT